MYTLPVTIDTTGNVGIGTTTPNSKLTVAGNILPDGDNLYDLGSPTNRWKDIYLGPASIKLYNSYTDESNYEYSSFTMTSVDGSDNSLDFDSADESDFTQEDLAYSVTLTPSATTGSGITLTLGSGNWNTTHKVKAGCRVVGNGGKADITADPAAQTTITASTTVDFTNTDAIGSGSWNIYCTDFDSAGAVEMSEKNVTAPTGGTITYDGDYTIHTFTSSGAFTAGKSFDVEYLVVGGGGAGGGNRSGGGGAGDFRTNSAYDHSVTAQAYSITVGAGGGIGGYPWAQGFNGEDSVFDTITSIGGGGGGRNELPGLNGGSGGGGGAIAAVGISTGEQGSNGGVGSNPSAGGGGGGAGVVGAAPVNDDYGGNGGNGLTSSISGSSVYYAGGGGGGVYNGLDGGSGGLGGGGDGESGGAVNGNPGTPNTGGGGGGGGSDTSHQYQGGGIGGSGIVIVRYLTADGGGGSSPTNSTYTITTSDTNQLDSSDWTDINSGTITETLNSQTINYSVSFDDRTTWKVADTSETGWRSIVKNDSGTWKYNSNVTWGSETWTATATNTQSWAFDDAYDVAANVMTGTKLNAITDTEWEATNGWSTSVDTIDFAMGLKTTSASQNPQVDSIYIDHEGGETDNQLTFGTYSAGTGSNMAIKLRTGTQNDGMILDTAGNVGIGTTNPTKRLYVSGDTYVTGDVSALTFTDRTPYPKDLVTAYAAVFSMMKLPEGEYEENNKEKQLDHSKLSDFIKSGEGRDLSATVSAQNEVIKDLIKRIEELENM